MLESPVLEARRHAGATMGEAFGWSVPSAYSSRESEYASVTGGVAVADRSYIGRLRINGDDAIDLLDRLSTNRLTDLEEGRLMGTVFTSNKGRIIDLVLLLRRADYLLAFTGPETRERIAEWIDFYTFAEDVTVVDDTESTAMLSLLGPRAADTVAGLAGLDLYESAELEIGGVEATVARTDFAGLPGYDIVAPSAGGDAIWMALVDNGAEPVGTAVLDMVRIEKGVPAYGAELNEDYNPLEAGLKGFISFNKGCYIGQEVVARLDTYDKVQRHMVGLSWSGGADVPAGTPLYAEGKAVGAITSISRDAMGAGEGLGFVRKAQVSQGVTLDTEGGVEVRVRPLADAKESDRE